MTAATITNAPSQLLAEDNVILTASDGETYTTKLSSAILVQVGYFEDMSLVDDHGTAVPVSAVISGREITFHMPGQTDKKIAVRVRGRL